MDRDEIELPPLPPFGIAPAPRGRRQAAEIALQEIIGFADHIVEAVEIAMKHLERFRKD